jgi:hypothetical protein
MCLLGIRWTAVMCTAVIKSGLMSKPATLGAVSRRSGMPNVLIQVVPETRLRMVSPADNIARLRHCLATVLFLGLQDDMAHFAIDMSQLGDPRHELNLDESWRFEDARTAATSLALLRLVFWPR